MPTMLESNGYALDVQPYCEGCREFSVGVKEESIYAEYNGGDPVVLRHIITCVHKRKCEKLINFLSKETKECQKETKDSTE